MQYGPPFSYDLQPPSISRNDKRVAHLCGTSDFLPGAVTLSLSFAPGTFSIHVKLESLSNLRQLGGLQARVSPSNIITRDIMKLRQKIVQQVHAIHSFTGITQNLFKSNKPCYDWRARVYTQGDCPGAVAFIKSMATLTFQGTS